MKRSTLRLTGLAVLLAFTLASGLSAQLATKKTLTLEAAKKIAAAAEAFAVKNKWDVVISVMDDGGHLLYLQRMVGAQLASIEISQLKARAALTYKRPTKVFEDRVASGGVNVLNLPGLAPFEGGLPITVGGEIVGSIGVSGVLSSQDGQIAAAGAAVISQ